MPDELFRSLASMWKSGTQWQGSVILALARNRQNRPEAPGPVVSVYALQWQEMDPTLTRWKMEETSGSCPLTST